MKKQKLLSINLPNGFLCEVTDPVLHAAQPEAVLLEGELFCVCCFSHFRSMVLIAQRMCRPTSGVLIPCPDCGVLILHLGTDNARALLTRIANTILPKGTKRVITPPKNNNKKKKKQS